ncbi:MAG: DUF4129 domain-containing protein [Gammaproteobacteria bacterium]
MPARSRRALAILWVVCLLPVPIALGAEADDATDDGDPALYASSPTGPVLRPEFLDDVLEQLDWPSSEPLTLWDRLMRWLEDFFADRQENAIPDWLKDFRLSETVAEWIFYTTCALIVILSIAIIANELRHHRRRGSLPKPMAVSAELAYGARPIDVDSLPPHERPGYLLRQLLHQLSLPGVDRRQASLTHREIERASGTLEPARRQPLVNVARVAERIRYADHLPPADEVDSAVADAERLLALLVPGP